jgi:hypothetical protein
MNCLNRLELQRFIDNEASIEELESFTSHIETCAQCRSLLETAKVEKDEIFKFLSFTMMDEKDISIPTFKIKSAKAQNKWVFYFSAAAASILIIISVFLHQKSNARNNRIARTNMEVAKSLYDADPNKLWNENKSIIAITDGDGNLIFSNITE